jgi:hypothetical protein
MHLLHGKKFVLPKLCCQVCLSAGVARSHAYITPNFKHIGFLSFLIFGIPAGPFWKESVYNISVLHLERNLVLPGMGRICEAQN